MLFLSLVYDGEVIDAKSLDKWRDELARGRELLGVGKMGRTRGPVCQLGGGADQTGPS